MSKYCKFDHFFGHCTTFQNWPNSGLDPLPQQPGTWTIKTMAWPYLPNHWKLAQPRLRQVPTSTSVILKVRRYLLFHPLFGWLHERPNSISSKSPTVTAILKPTLQILQRILHTSSCNNKTSCCSSRSCEKWVFDVLATIFLTINYAKLNNNPLLFYLAFDNASSLVLIRRTADS